MQDEPWKYRIGSGPAGPILALALLALFGGLSVWLYLAGNGAFLFGLMLTLVAAAALLAALYQTLFIVVRLGERGFYHRTGPGNGRYLPYEEIVKAYVSAGRNLNGTQNGVCHYETYSGQAGRFLFFPADWEGVEWFLQCVQAQGAGDKTPAAGEDLEDYQLDGKGYGKAHIVAALAILALFVALAACLRGSGLPAVAWAGGVALGLGLVAVSVVRYFCFKVQIGATGFYVKTTPFHGRYYQYRDIQRCEVQRKVYHNRGGSLYYDYFLFTPKDGRTRRFQFQRPLQGHEINVLTARIKKGSS